MKKIVTLALLTIVFFFEKTCANPLSGNYTINSSVVTGGTNFQSFNDFADSINTNGISASVIVTVVPGSGPYNEQVIFSNIQGTSLSSTVTLEGSGETITALTTTNDRHVVRLSNLQYFSINNLRVAWDPASSGGFYGIHIFQTGSNITISNCTIDLGNTTSTLYGGIVASGSETSILFTGDFHNINITGNTSSGGGYGASVFGLISNLASGIVISGNNFYDFHSNGVYLRETDGAVISNNHFDKRTSNVTSANAIQLAQAANINGQIFNNVIQVSQTSNGSQTLRGIYLFNGTGHKVYNNVIRNIHLTSGNFTAIEVRTGGTAPEISFNTISIDTTATNTGALYGITEELSNTNSILRNNIISISQPATEKAALVLASNSTVTSAFISNHNLFWVPSGGNVAIKGSITPVLYTSLTDWQTASGQDLNSFETDPLFLSTTNPIPSSSFADNTGIAIAGITTDFTGALRSNTPDIGAYEFISTGIESQENYLQDLVGFPNPTSGLFTIETRNEKLKFYAYSVVDITGKTVLFENINIGFHARSFTINVAEIPCGVYLIQLISNEKNYNYRFIKKDN